MTAAGRYAVNRKEKSGRKKNENKRKEQTEGTKDERNRRGKEGRRLE
jgi:hypothetical protein